MESMGIGSMSGKRIGVNVSLIASTLMVLWLGKALPGMVSESGRQPLVLAGYLLVAMGWIWFLSASSEARLFSRLGAWRSAWLLWGAVLGPVLFVIAGAGYVVSARLGLSPPAEAALGEAFQGIAMVLLVFLVVTMAILEEWLFRGVILNSLRPRSVAIAVIVSAVAFSLYHLSLFQLFPTLLLGVGLALIVVYFGAIWPAVVAHALFNVLGVLLSALGQYGGSGG